jgi:hypothetical protein
MQPTSVADTWPAGLQADIPLPIGRAGRTPVPVIVALLFDRVGSNVEAMAPAVHPAGGQS